MLPLRLALLVRVLALLVLLPAVPVSALLVPQLLLERLVRVVLLAPLLVPPLPPERARGA